MGKLGRLSLGGLLCLGVLTLRVQALPMQSGEQLGTLTVSDILLRPSFILKEPSNGQFSLGESSLAVKWDLDNIYSSVIRIGQRDLLNPTAHFTSSVDTDLVLAEAYAQYKHPYLGRFRFGMQPVLFGLEGEKSESELIFPRPLLFQMRAMALRDLGFGYEIENNNFFTGILVHNGESGPDKDGKLWYTARWGYRIRRFEIGVSGQTGRTSPLSTKDSEDTLAGVDPTKPAKWRIGGFHVAWTPPRFEIEMEGYIGARDQEDKTRKFSTGHTDVGYEFSDLFSSHLRVDYFDPDSEVNNNALYQGSVALVFTNKSRNSRLIVVGTKAIEEGRHQTHNDEARLIWSLSPTQVFSNF